MAIRDGLRLMCRYRSYYTNLLIEFDGTCIVTRLKSLSTFARLHHMCDNNIATCDNNGHIGAHSHCTATVFFGLTGRNIYSCFQPLQIERFEF